MHSPAISGRGLPVPAFECTVESALLGIPGQKGDFGQGIFVTAEQPDSKIPARFIDEILIDMPLFGQTPLKGSTAHAESSRYFGDSWYALAERLRNVHTNPLIESAIVD